MEVLVRALLANWHFRLSLVWYGLEKDAIVFYGILPMPFAVLASLLYLAHESHAVHESHKAQEQVTALEVRAEDLECLAKNVHHEARGEPLEGQYAVAEVTMNRVASSLFPKSVCEVVHEQRWDARRRRYVGAFSWTELDGVGEPSGSAWQRAQEVAAAVYDGTHSPRVPNALYYHAKHIKPRWANANRRVATIGRHVFYR
jgi:spore germination cell wall hydrolase CwlJ-like protein